MKTIENLNAGHRPTQLRVFFILSIIALAAYGAYLLAGGSTFWMAQ